MKHLTGFLLVSLAYVSVFAASEGSVSMELGKPNSSTSNRVRKDFAILASPVGLGPSSNVESGLIAGVFLSPQTILQLESGDGNTESNGGFVVFGNRTIKNHTSSASLMVKHFVGNSFYVKAGVDNRKINYSEAYKSTWSLFGSTYEDSFAFNADSWTGSLVIGNQWQWDNFTLGCDWFGIAAPFASKVNSESYATNSTDTTTVKNDLADQQRKSLKDVAYQGIKFYIGASF